MAALAPATKTPTNTTPPHSRSRIRQHLDPRQDDYDIWLGTDTIQPWIAWSRHTKSANYLYLDGHATTLPWQAAVLDMYPEKGVLIHDATYQQ